MVSVKAGVGEIERFDSSPTKVPSSYGRGLTVIFD